MLSLSWLALQRSVMLACTSFADRRSNHGHRSFHQENVDGKLQSQLPMSKCIQKHHRAHQMFIVQTKLKYDLHVSRISLISQSTESTIFLLCHFMPRKQTKVRHKILSQNRWPRRYPSERKALLTFCLAYLTRISAW